MHNFVLLQFLTGILAFYMFYAIPMYYLEVSKELDTEHLAYFNKYKLRLVLWWFMGFVCASLTLTGAVMCMCFGMLGYGMASWILFDAIWSDSTLIMNPYPFILTFALPIFVGTFFMSLMYFQLIMRGSNKKIQGNFVTITSIASIQKFEKQNNRKYKIKNEGIGEKLLRLLRVLFWDAVPESDLKLS